MLKVLDNFNNKNTTCVRYGVLFMKSDMDLGKSSGEEKSSNKALTWLYISLGKYSSGKKWGLAYKNLAVLRIHDISLWIRNWIQQDPDPRIHASDK